MYLQSEREEEGRVGMDEGVSERDQKGEGDKGRKITRRQTI